MLMQNFGNQGILWEMCKGRIHIRGQFIKFIQAVAIALDTENNSIPIKVVLN